MSNKTTAKTMATAIKNIALEVRDFIDEFGRPGWIAAMVLGFVWWWPVGLFIVLYMAWRDKQGEHNGEH